MDNFGKPAFKPYVSGKALITYSIHVFEMTKGQVLVLQFTHVTVIVFDADSCTKF